MRENETIRRKEEWTLRTYNSSVYRQTNEIENKYFISRLYLIYLVGVLASRSGFVLSIIKWNKRTNVFWYILISQFSLFLNKSNNSWTFFIQINLNLRWTLDITSNEMTWTIISKQLGEIASISNFQFDAILMIPNHNIEIFRFVSKQKKNIFCIAKWQFTVQRIRL